MSIEPTSLQKKSVGLLNFTTPDPPTLNPTPWSQFNGTHKKMLLFLLENLVDIEFSVNECWKKVENVFSQELIAVELVVSLINIYEVQKQKLKK